VRNDDVRAVGLAFVGAMSLFIIATGCRGKRDSDQTAANRLACDTVLFAGLAIPLRSEAEATTYFGPRARSRQAIEPNKHDETRTDTVLEIRAEELSVRFRRAAGRSFLEQVDVWQPRVLRYPDIGPGASIGHVTDRLGMPTDSGAGRLLFVCESGGMLLYEQAADRVGALRLLFYVE
jgi:hypothetical protein